MNVKEIRKYMKKSINEMSELCGVNRKTLEKWETNNEMNKRQPTHATQNFLELLLWLNKNYPKVLDEYSKGNK